ncbi:MAG: hypothetical protein K2N85_04550 [Lachnospiraceae bacterium]|nr:hypothetical protein [Lachnospiraceae bacterium]
MKKFAFIHDVLNIKEDRLERSEKFDVILGVEEWRRDNMEKRCKDYVGIACVDGSCPKANRDRCEECCMNVISICNECFYI